MPRRTPLCPQGPIVHGDLAGARELMLQQVALIKTEAPHIPAGGAMLVAELSKDRLQFWREPFEQRPANCALPPIRQVFGHGWERDRQAADI
jgi:hypothetical protein